MKRSVVNCFVHTLCIVLVLLVLDTSGRECGDAQCKSKLRKIGRRKATTTEGPRSARYLSHGLALLGQSLWTDIALSFSCPGTALC